MAHGGGSFSDEEIQLLRQLPAVANVTKDRITYSDAFKQVCTIRYLAGESPTKIFREAGLPPDLVGYKRIERSVARWKAAAIKSVNGSGEMDDSEVIAQLVERYKRALVTRRNLDSITNIINEPMKAGHPYAPDASATRTAPAQGMIDVGTAGIIIKQQARRIDELERANSELRAKLGDAVPSLATGV
ncbi:HTH domain-containing protein [Bifidobacterium sp. UBA6881]|uniref:HTH domain-containing protein n=1 Tax=Bifidobacterium sp. UBA6881 TaxID=1946109 RepID=UPI0025B7DA8F|nr:HTH domain-containing protein [Bifidobacterium sp. UBA6881]